MKIYLLTLPNGSFESAGQSWLQLDLKKLQAELDFPVIVKSILKIAELNLEADDIIIYTSSENVSIRQYLQDNLYYISKSNYLIPSYELLNAHENKGFQEIMKRTYDFGNLKGSYIFNLKDQTLPLPKVLKTSTGAGSSGVFLIKDKKDLSAIRNRFFKINLKKRIITTQRKLKLKKSAYALYKYNKQPFKPFVEQEFIPNLKHDFKVLVFGNRYYVLKRSVKKNDFRASGSGNFEFIEPSIIILNFAKQIANVLDNPYLSLDIAQSDKGCHLIEFQATNFGPYTLLNAPNRYVDENNNWHKEKNDKSLEANYAYALNYYFKSKNLNYF